MILEKKLFHILCQFLMALSLASCSAHYPLVTERAPSSILSDSCRKLFAKFFNGNQLAKDFWENSELSSLKSFLETSEKEFADITLLQDMILLILSESLSEDQLKILLSKKLVDESYKWLSANEFRLRLKSILPNDKGLKSYGFLERFVSAYEEAIRLSHRDKINPFESFKKMLKKISSKTDSEKIEIHKQIDERIKLGKLEKDLSDPNLFVIKRIENEVEFSNGVRLSVLSQKRDGSLVVGVPYRWIMPTQDYFNAQIAAEYRADPKLKSMTFEGTWLPDGRVMIFDQHHRTQAYFTEIGDPIPFRLNLQSDGSYRSLSYLYPMQFYTSWNSIPLSEKDLLVKKLEELRNRNDLNDERRFEEIRKLSEDLYLRTLRLKRTFLSN